MLNSERGLGLPEENRIPSLQVAYILGGGSRLDMNSYSAVVEISVTGETGNGCCASAGRDSLTLPREVDRTRVWIGRLTFTS